jgi:hypothetical protein
VRQILITGFAVLAALLGRHGASAVVSRTSGAPPAAALAALTPEVRAEIHDADDNIVTGTDVPEATPLHVAASVRGSGPLPAGTAAFDAYDTPDCSGLPSGEQDAALTGGTEPVAHSLEISNDGGWDSATIWSSQAGDGFDTDWSGSVFMGTDPPFFSHSGAGWRFAGLPLSPTDTIDAAYLLLRIQKSRPNLASESFGTWRTAIRTDSASGAGFAGLDHNSFAGRFNSAGVTWEVPFSFAQPDSFGTQQGALYARSPDISSLIAARTADASWIAGGDIVVGILDDASTPTAEAQVVDAAGNVRLHIDWTSHEPVAQAESTPSTPAPGPHSYRVHYGGDATYVATDSACSAVTVSSKDTDGDGYSDAQEEAIGKDPFTYCGAMRADVDGDGVVSILDMAQVAQWFGDSVPPAPRRFTQAGGTRISILDLARMATYLSRPVTSCP